MKKDFIVTGLFSLEDRARLFHLMIEMIDMPYYDWMASGPVGGKEFLALEKLLMHELGRYSLGEGAARDRLQYFTEHESDDAILQMVKLTPVAVFQTMLEKRKELSIRYPFSEKEDEKRFDKITVALNAWLEGVGSSARFVNGEFLEDGILDATPKALKDLPKKEHLLEDLRFVLQEHRIVTVVFIDLDHFKNVNDMLGHAEGDKCLEKVVEIIGAAIAGKGKLYRYGGDEFIIVLRNFTREEATTTSERIRSKIDHENPGGSVKVTASVGLACADQDNKISPEALLHLADEAMYTAKKDGKNRVK